MRAKNQAILCRRSGCGGVVVPAEELGSVSQGEEYPCRKCWNWFVVTSDYGAPITVNHSEEN
jgi:hypothetical protein